MSRIIAECPVCGEDTFVYEPIEICSLVLCDNCKTVLEIASASNDFIVLKEAPEVEEKGGE